MIELLRWFLIYYCAYYNAGFTQHDAALASVVDLACGIRG